MKLYLGDSKRGGGSEERYNCPFCSQRGKSQDTEYHLYLNRGKRVFNCFRCGVSGMVTEHGDFYISGYKGERFESDLIIEGNKLIKKEILRKEEKKENLLVEKKVNDFEKLYTIDTIIGRMAQRYWEERGFDKLNAEFFDIRLDEDMYRIIIPIKDLEGENKFYIGRAFTDFTKPKYWLSPGSDKSDCIFNLHRAKEFVEVFLFEGSLDVISGGPDCIAILGKDLGDGQLKQLCSTNIRKIFICLDRDVSNKEIIKIKEKLRLDFDTELMKLPVEGDLNDMLKIKGKKEVRRFLDDFKKKRD